MPSSPQSTASPPHGFWPGRRVLVAGGTHGFGLVLARLLVARGAHVMLVGRSSASVRQAIASCEQTECKGTVRGLAADLSRAGEGDRAVATCTDQLGGLDTLIFCIGRSSRTAILKVAASELRDTIETNLMTAVEVSQAAADSICQAGGRLVYIGSLAGKFVTPAMGGYAVGKAALAAFVDAIRLEVEPRGARVLLVSPGPIRQDGDNAVATSQAGFHRYDADVARHDLPTHLAQPGGGTSLRLLDPEHLASEVLDACERGVPELTRPWKATLLAGLIEWFPRWGRQVLARFAGRAKNPRN